MLPSFVECLEFRKIKVPKMNFSMPLFKYFNIIMHHNTHKKQFLVKTSGDES